VVVMTAYDTPEYVKQAGEAGAGAYLVKIPAAREIEHAVSIAIARFSDSVCKQQEHRIEKAESLARMAGAVAHHFNNTLMSVTGNLELAMRKLAPDTDIARYLSEALKGTWRAADISGLMLTYLGQSQGKVVPFDLALVCRLYFDQLPVDLPEEVRIKTELPSPGPAVDADVSQVRKVITTLVTNAVEAMQQNVSGNVLVAVNTARAAEIPADCRFPAEWTPLAEIYARLSVTDNGRGMDAETVSKIFDPFYTDKFTGRGLGLAVALGIVKSCDGCITVTSEPGQGSVFHVFLPLSSKTAIEPEARVTAEEVSSGGLILIADDQECVREVAEEMLKLLGYETIMAADGAEAVEIFRTKQAEIRLVISDLSMPKMNGWETLAALRRIRPDIPVILSSGYDQATAMDANQAEQPQVFLPKPYQINRLKDALAKAL
jgi:signal transduction histidine kinase